MRFMVLLPVCIALAAPAQAQHGSEISGFTSYVSKYPAEPLNGYYQDEICYAAQEKKKRMNRTTH